MVYVCDDNYDCEDGYDEDVEVCTAGELHLVKGNVVILTKYLSRAAQNLSF